MSKDTSIVVGKHYKQIDGLRGLACLLVVWFHAAGVITPGAESEVLFGNGYRVFTLIGATGVNLFFILSGFLITGILMDTSDLAGRLKKFYLRRVFRIFPLYYAFLCIALIAFFVVFSDREYLKWFTHLFYFQNWATSFRTDHYKYINHLWSLAVEEQFYIVWPIVFLFFYDRQDPRKAVGLCLFTILMAWYIHGFFISEEQYFLGYMFTLSRMDGLAMGALLSVLLMHYKDALLHYGSFMKYVMVLAAAISLSSLMWPSEYNSFFIFLSYGVTFATIFYFALVWVVIANAQHDWFRAVLLMPLLLYVGRVSYGLYIFHVPVLELLHQALEPWGLNFWQKHVFLVAVGLAVATILAHLSYSYFERRILVLKDKFAPLH